jgi:hypothetical protein
MARAMTKTPWGYMQDVERTRIAVRDWLVVHPGTCPTLEYVGRGVVSGDLGDLALMGLATTFERVREILRYDDAGVALAEYVAKRVPRCTLLMLVSCVEVATKGKA